MSRLGTKERTQKSLAQTHVHERNTCNTKKEVIKAPCALKKCGFFLFRGSVINCDSD